MINLIATSPKTAIEKIGVEDYRVYCGLLTSPKNGNLPIRAIENGAMWAMDNDAFTGFHSKRFLSKLNRLKGSPHCLFVVSPDCVGNAALTLDYFWYWQPIIHAMGYPVALALQNGMEGYAMPWGYISAVFIGGDTLFKYTPYVASIAKEAKQRGVWIHMGRVNSHQRIRHAFAIGCDSFDGTGYAIEPERIRKELYWWKTPIQTPIQYTLLEA